ncbi:unnamed protein product, partial [Pylaiella littoralis]
AISLTACLSSFDGLSECGVNDTVFWNSKVARKGGAIVIGSGSFPSHVELHRCNIFNSTVGKEIKDDPQGEGGAIAVAQTVSLLLADCVLTENYCGKKEQQTHPTRTPHTTTHTTSRRGPEWDGVWHSSSSSRAADGDGARLVLCVRGERNTDRYLLLLLL